LPEEAAKANDTITLSFAGANGKVILGDTTVDANGAVITLTEGQTQARFSLVHDGELDADAVASRAPPTTAAAPPPPATPGA